MVNLSSLMDPMQTGERFKPNEEVIENCGIGVHCPIEKSDLYIIGVNLV